MGKRGRGTSQVKYFPVEFPAHDFQFTIAVTDNIGLNDMAGV